MSRLGETSCLGGSYFIDCLLAAGEDTLIVERAKGSESNLRQILRLKTVHLLSAFMIIYVGAEVTIGGESYDENLDAVLKMRRMDCELYASRTRRKPMVRLCSDWVLCW